MRLTVETTPDDILVSPAPLFATTSVDALFGSLSYEGLAKSIADMNAAIGGGIARIER